MKRAPIQREYRFGTGASSVLMILLVLSLTILGLLSLGGAQNDLKLTRRSVDMTVSYYEAADRLQQALAQLDGYLSRENIQSLPDLESRLSDFSFTDVLVVPQEPDTVQLITDAGEERQLKMVLKLKPGLGKRYAIAAHLLEDTRNQKGGEENGL